VTGAGAALRVRGKPPVFLHVEEIHEWFWRDNVKAKRMLPDGTYIPRRTDEPPFDAQAEFPRRRPAPPRAAPQDARVAPACVRDSIR
jgi:hypothetical protein